MVDPATAAMGIGATNASINVASNVTKAVRGVRKRWRLLGTFEPQWLEIDKATGTGLTKSQIEDIERFLRSDRMQPTLGLLAVAKLSPNSSDRDEAISIAHQLMLNEIKRWNVNAEQKWEQHASWLTTRIEHLHDGVIGPQHLKMIREEELEDYGSFIQSPLLFGEKMDNSVGYLKKLVGVSSNIDQLAYAISTSQKLAHLIASASHEPIITHTELDDSSDFESLYVSRNFVDADDDHLVVESNELDPSVNPFRIIVMGDPGAGKSTFVQHMKKQVSNLSGRQVPVVEVVCRRYAKSAWETSLLSFMAAEINRDFAVPLAERDVENMLLLGRICLVFDGLDEITDQRKRAQMVTRINHLVAQYPTCSFLATTRLLGYERAPMSRRLFTHVKLEQFNDDQLKDYCERWFSAKNRSDLTDSFITDSRSVGDLRNNPLMLSLLCALYREHGSLPTDRRDVYSRCADLLFRRWDSHRQIEHDGAMPGYAPRLMQEIARWVYTSKGLEDGLAEPVLVKILAQSLQDRDGFDPDDAQRDAQSFLSFCAGRAWLLASFGTNSHGHRIFRFTHRTFLEFFAAEAIARRAKSAETVSEEIAKAFSRDATSVVPELLIQAFNFKDEGGGADVFNQLLKSNASNLLLLRLMEGVGMNAHIRRRAFIKIFDRWVQDGLTRHEFDLVLDSNPQMRQQIVREFLHTGHGAYGTVERQQVFLSGWSGKCLARYKSRHVEFWSSAMNDVARLLTPRSPASANWCVTRGIHPSGYRWLGWDGVACPSAYGGVPGIVWWAIEARFAHHTYVVGEPIRTAALDSVYGHLQNGSLVPKPLVDDFCSYIADSGAGGLQWRHPTTPSESTDMQLITLLIHVMCMVHEAGSDVAPFVRILVQLKTGEGRLALALRDANAGIGPHLSSRAGQLATEFFQDQPFWIRRWFAGDSSFVQFSD